MSWYQLENAALVDTPALLFYKSRIRQNIEAVISTIGDSSRLRPHIKTNKTKEVCQMMLGAGIKKFKCATIAEAELLGLIKADDVLMAYQPVGPKIQRFVNVVKAYPYTRYSCLIDNITSAEEIGKVFSDEGLRARLWIDLNTGMNRTGLCPAIAHRLIDELIGIQSVDIAGIHFYDGHIADPDAQKRKSESDKGFDIVEKVKKYFKEKTGRELVVAGGGSPTFEFHVERKMECTPGTFVFWDMGYKNLLPGAPFVFSALIATRIVSIVSDILVTCDLGYKSVAAENPLPRVYFLNAPDAKPHFQNEEHLVLKVQEGLKYNVGDILYGVPEHICPTVALFDEAVVVEDHRVIDQWEISARKRKINY